MAQPGALDPTFGGDGTVTIAFDIPPEAVDQVETTGPGATQLATLDPVPGVAGTLVAGLHGFDSANALAVQPDGRILAVGLAGGAAGDTELAAARLLPDGSLDAGFGVGGRVVIEFDAGGEFSDAATGVVIQPDGGIVLCGGTLVDDLQGDVAVARLTPAGALDPAFGTSGRVVFGTELGGPLYDLVFDCAVDPMGRIVVAGLVILSTTNADFLVARLLADGALDPTFDTDGVTTVPFDLGGTGVDAARALAIQPDGRIILAGLAEDAVPDYEVALARLLVDGSLDPTFGAGGRVTVALDLGGNLWDEATDVGLAPDGRIVVAGKVAGANGWDFLAARFLADGTLDPSFGGDGWATAGFDLGGDLHDEGWALALQSDGKAVVVGGVETDLPAGSQDRDFGAVRFNGDGSLDLGFGVSGRTVVASGPDPSITGYAEAAALQPDGRIVLGNESTDGENTDFLLARLNNDAIFADGFESGETSAWSTTTP
jgi:uncharacterized delta-60 repeat protein